MTSERRDAGTITGETVQRSHREEEQSIMKKSGILHSELARIVAGMGHGDALVICDSGFPIPHGRHVADVVLTVGVPGLIQTRATASLRLPVP